MKTLYTLLFLVLTPNLFSQSISGTIYAMETGETILFASLAVYQNDELITGTISDIEGKYLIENLEPGEYTLNVCYLGYEDFIDTLYIGNYNITENTILLNERSYIMDEVVIIAYKVPSKGCCCYCWGGVRSDEIDSSNNTFEKQKNNKKSESSILLYPNPTHDLLNIKLGELASKLVILDYSGKEVYNTNIYSQQHSLSVSEWANGFYLVNTYTNNQLISSEKLIVQNRL